MTLFSVLARASRQSLTKPRLHCNIFNTVGTKNNHKELKGIQNWYLNTYKQVPNCCTLRIFEQLNPMPYGISISTMLLGHGGVKNFLDMKK